MIIPPKIKLRIFKGKGPDTIALYFSSASDTSLTLSVDN